MLYCVLSVPTDLNRRKLWISAIETYQEFDYYVSKFYVFELHFVEGSIRKFGNRSIVDPNDVPTILPAM